MRLTLALYLCIASCSAAFASVDVIHKDPLLELVSVYHPPYHDKNLPHNGFVSEIVRQAFAFKHYNIEIDFYVAKRAVDVAKFNFVDGIFMLRYSSEDDNNFYFSKPILYINLNVLKMNSNTKLTAKYTEVSQLKALTIAVGENCVLPAILDDDSFNIKETIDDKSAIWLLISGKVDLALVDERVAKELLTTTFKDFDQKMSFWSDKPISETAQYFAVSRHHPKAKKIIFNFNSGLEHIKVSGEYNKIISSIDK